MPIISLIPLCGVGRDRRPRRARRAAVLLAGLAILALARSAMPCSAPIMPASNGGSGRGRPIAPGRSAISASAGSLLENLDKVKVIRCDEVQWRFLGISLAGYNVLISLLMAAIAGMGDGQERQALNPHGEEARSAVSNHEASMRAFILQDAASRAPQDEGEQLSIVHVVLRPSEQMDDAGRWRW